MQFSEKWLRSWANPSIDTDALSHLLTMAGLEVEETVAAAPMFSGVVVAEVKEVKQHENADRLRVTQVDVGTGELIQIVCGAPNVAVGLKVPCATNGALLPGNFKIKPTKMRGEPSNGMLCSGKELGIPDDVDGLLVLPADAPVGSNIRDYLGLDDQCFTLKITPNRTDCLSIKGIAREVAALTACPLTPVAVKAVAPTLSDTFPIAIEDKAACGRYIGRVIKGVNAKAVTPDWIKERLERSGIRAISAIVDITNYVMLELGQPMHAFDLDKLAGGIQVRRACAGEKLKCLNEKEVTLSESTLVIADQTGPLALAGLMGGESSSVGDETQNIFFESAFFAPDVIAGRSREYGFGSDSSFRFERGVDIALQAEAMERATELVLAICGGQAGPSQEVLGELPTRQQVKLRTTRVSKVLGVAFTAEKIAEILTLLGLPFETVEDGFMVTAPSFRFDIAIEEDLIEEVARVYGYENVPSDAPRSGLRMLPLPENKRPRNDVRVALAGRDYQEIVSYAFVDEKWEADFANNQNPIRLINPIASQMSVMRSTLLGGLINTLVGNINRKQARVRLFEIARVFQRAESGFAQPERVAGLAWGARCAEQWGEATVKVDFFDVKADVESLFFPNKLNFVKNTAHPALHPGRAASIVLNGQEVGVMGELHPNWVHAYDLPNAPVVFELNMAALMTIEPVKAQAVSKLQPVRRDLAFVLDEAVEVGALLSTLRDGANAIVKQIEVFDVYRGKGIEEGKKSVAISVILQDMEKTLTDDDVEPAIAKLIRLAETNHQAKLRL